MGQSGRDQVHAMIGKLRKKWALDFVIANGENATHGRGPSKTHAMELLDAGIDCLTLGDHAFDQKSLHMFLSKNDAIVRPLNIDTKHPGKGLQIFTLKDGRKILVMQILGTIFMKMPASNPFKSVASILQKYPLGDAIHASLIDFHAEATSEKMAMGHWCDGRVSVVAGTHTHVPTADMMILPAGTAYQSDVGMCGDYLSVIGMNKDEPICRFVTGKHNNPFTPATKTATLCGLFIETDDKTGKAKTASPVRINGKLLPAQPSIEHTNKTHA